MLYFFLSYAPDEDDIFVHRLYQDLSAEIVRRIGAEPEQVVGYLDDIGGSSWPVDARTALSTCQTFIALCSSKYLASDRCGRYWGIFVDRIHNDDSDSGREVDSLIPLLWAADSVPDDVFHEPGLDVRPHRTPNGDDLREQMRAIRNDLQFYGLRREDWAPYQPVAPQSLAARACGIVSDRRLQSEVVPIESVPERLRKGLQRDILVLLVDAWAPRVDDLDRALREIGKQDDEAVAVLMPASPDDGETSARRGELRGEVLKSFPGRSSWRDSLFRIGVDSPDEFDADLSVAIAAAQRRAYRRGWPARQPDASRSTARRPVLEGP